MAPPVSEDSKRVDHTRIKVVPNLTKRCPFCSSVLGLKEKQCYSCKQKVGEVDKLGVAKIPGRWKSYISFGVAAAIVAAYFWWAFFR